MRSRQLHDALEHLTRAIREVESVVETMRADSTHVYEVRLRKDKRGVDLISNRTRFKSGG